VQVEPPASNNQASTHARTVSRSRRQCTGAPAAGCARHSPQARRQHAGPDLADLVATQIEGHAWRQHAGPDLADLVAVKEEVPARSNITHTRTRAQHTHTQTTHTHNTHTTHAHTHTVSRSRRQCTGARHSRHARRQLTRADARPVSSSQHALATHGTRAHGSRALTMAQCRQTRRPAPTRCPDD
jgi:hypothetical protein